jgi:hypothetical protein
MELFCAFLTALFFCLFLEYRRWDLRVRARREAGPLVQEIALSRRARIWLFAAMIGASIAGLLPMIVLLARGLPELNGMIMFIWTFWPASFVMYRPWRKFTLEVREYAVLFPLWNVEFIPWCEVRYCQWCSDHRDLLIERRQSPKYCRIVADQIAAATAALSRYVEVRDSEGNTIASPTFAPDGTARPALRAEHPKVVFRRFQYDLRMMLFFMVVASAAFGWLGVNYRERDKQEQAVAEFAAFQPDVHRSGFNVTWIDFDKCAKKPGDADLVHLAPLQSLIILSLNNAPVTDAGLKHLYVLKRLKNVSLFGTQVTKQGVDDLKRALPKVFVIWMPNFPMPPSPSATSPIPPAPSSPPPHP